MCRNSKFENNNSDKPVGSTADISTVVFGILTTFSTAGIFDIMRNMSATSHSECTSYLLPFTLHAIPTLFSILQPMDFEADQKAASTPQDLDLELGLLPGTDTSTSSELLSSNQLNILHQAPDAHDIFGDILELFSRHLRSRH